MNPNDSPRTAHVFAKPANGRTSFAAARNRGRYTSLHNQAPRVVARARIGIVSNPYNLDSSRWSSIRSQMEQILAEHGSRGGEVVSLLAAVTDRLFASVALGQSMRLSLVIPCVDFERLLPTPADLSEYLYLRTAATSKTVLKHRKLTTEAFDEAARLVVDTCDLVVVVGNGKAPSGPLNTGSIVHYATEQSKLLAWIDPEAPGISTRPSPIR